MTAHPSRLRAVLALGRMANLPTVWANVLAATWLGGIHDVGTVLILAAGASLLYVGGAALNDACDVAFDRTHRPERAIPAGVFSLRTVVIGASLCLALGAALMALRASVPAVLALVTFVVTYDFLHKKTKAGVLLMAGCRTALYVAAGTPAGQPVSATVFVCGLAVGVYIVALSTFARRESTGEAPSPAILVLLLCPLVAQYEAAGTAGWWVSSALFAGWIVYTCLPLLRRRGNIGEAVGKWLAGLVLIDLHFVAPTAPIAVWAVLMALFLLARGLQALAPAT